MDVHLRNKTWAIGRAGLGEYYRLRDHLMSRRPDVLTPAANAINLVADPVARDRLGAVALDRATRDVPLSEAEDFSKTAEGVMLLITWRLQATYPDENFTVDEVFAAFVSGEQSQSVPEPEPMPAAPESKISDR